MLNGAATPRRTAGEGLALKVRYEAKRADAPLQEAERRSCRHTVSGMLSVLGVAWGSVELEPEVRDWILALPDAEFGRVEFYIDLLA